MKTRIFHNLVQVTLLLLLLLLEKGSHCKPFSRNNSLSQQNIEKKGTIRIAGPWHSESALDRNIDPGEDSYVKKIISSNEGINFNKDIAESGEVFDINGIEDFYDQNALITYEINGHEIPVHMKPKYTPQSKSMFPEYVKELPASIGLTRQSKQSSKDGHHQYIQNTNNHIGTFSALTMKDMPEYGVRDSPEVKSENAGPDRKFPIQKFLQTHKISYKQLDNDNLKLPWKTADSTGHLLTQEREQNRLTNSDEQAASHENRLITSNKQASHENKLKNLDEQEGRAYENTHTKLIDQNHLVSDDELMKAKYFHQLLRQHENEDNKQQNVNDMLTESKHFQQRLKPEVDDEDLRKPELGVAYKFHKFSNSINSPVDKNENTEESISNILHNGIQDHALNHANPIDNDISRHVDAPNNNKQILNEFMHQSNAPEPTHVFEKLETLQHKLTADKGHEQLEQSKSSQDAVETSSVEPEKAKAKAKILNLLGELTNKLKGMEAVVSGGNQEQKFIPESKTRELENTHDTKDVLNFNKDEIKSFVGSTKELKHSQEQDFSKYAPKVTHSMMETVVESPSESHLYHNSNPKEIELTTDEGEGANDYENAHTTGHKAKTYADKKVDVESHENIIPQKMFHELVPEDDEEQELSNYNYQQKPSTEMISKYREQNKPFIMNTDSIDYIPDTESKFSKTADNTEGSRDDSESAEPDHSDSITSKRLHYHENVDREGSDNSDSSNHYLKYKQTHRRHHQEISENKDNDDDENILKYDFRKPSRKYKHKSFQNEEEKEDEEKEEDQYEESIKKENEKIKETTKDEDETKEEVAESLASADEDKYASERTFRPKLINQEDIEYPDYNEVKDAAIFEANLLRRRYHANKLIWSDELSDQAQKSAEKLSHIVDINSKVIDSIKAPSKNIALVKLNSSNVGKEATDMWAREAKNYDFKSPLITKRNSDFVQLMWKGSKKFGMGVAKSKSGKGWNVVSVYDNAYVDNFNDLRRNLESDLPIDDPYGDITG